MKAIYDEIQAQLGELKARCGGSSELLAMAAMLVGRMDSERIRVLDVGTADGVAFLKLLSELAHAGHRVDGVGVDPAATSRVHSQPGIRVEFAARLYTGSEYVNFDLIIARQSLYYFESVPELIRSLHAALRDNGLLQVVVWNGSCVLRRLLESVAPAHASLRLDAATVTAAAEATGFRLEGSASFEGQFALPTELSEAMPILTLLLRGEPFPPRAAQSLSRFLAEEAPTGTRRNEILLFRKTNGTRKAS